MAPEISDTDQKAEAQEKGRRLFAGSCDFLIGAMSLDQLPDSELPEIAFAGRSNVGKSSLINALTGRRALARTSNTPGRTQQLNYFDLAHRLMLVDLPGYGFAAAPKDTVKKWQHLVDNYLRGRVQLRRVCLLVDGRHGLKTIDHEVMKMLNDAAVSYQVVLTKTDKLKTNALAKLIAQTTDQLRAQVAAHPDLMATSAEKGAGVSELRATLAALALDDAGESGL